MFDNKKRNHEALINALQSKKIRKIYLVGSVGSGKTTLGKVLAKELQLSFYEMDNIIFERLPLKDRKRSDEEINKLVKSIIEQETWLIEGTCLRDIVQPIFNQSQAIIFLDMPYMLRVYRFSKRFLKQLLHLEQANYKPSFKMYVNMFKWNHSFEKTGYQTFIIRTKNYPDKRINYNKKKL